MAEKSYGVKIGANVDAYEAAMKRAGASTDAMAKQSASNFQKVGGELQKLGGGMSKYLTVPIVGAAAAAVKLSTDFDTAFTRMVNLAGVTSGEVDGLKKSVLALAGQTAQAPEALADALYSAKSAGLTTAQAMDTVTVAAKAAAVGMGSAEDIVGLVASATASYGAANISAAQATDILTAAVRDGRADPSELAGSLGKLLPIAGSLGVTFPEVGGAVAYLSNIMGNTSTTVDGFQQVLKNLYAPSAQGKQALIELGTSADQLKTAVSTNGLQGALELLRTHGFTTNSNALHALFEDTNAMSAAAALLQDNSGSLQHTLDDVAGSAGALDTAFDNTSKTTGFKMKQAWADMQVALIQAGDVIVPIVSKIAGGIATLAGAFTSLSKPAQDVVLAVLGIAAVAGPVTSAIGTILKHYQQLSSFIDKIGASTRSGTGAMSSFGGAMGELGGVAAGTAAGLGALLLIGSQIKDNNDEARASIEGYLAALKAQAAGQQDAVRQQIASDIADQSYVDTLTKFGLTASDVADVIQGKQVPAYDAARQAALYLSGRQDLLTAGQLEGAKAAAEHAKALGVTGDAAIGMVIKTGDLTNALSAAQEKFDFVTTVAAQVGVEQTSTAGTAALLTTAFQRVGGAADDVVSATDPATDAVHAMGEAARDSATGTDQMAAADKALADAASKAQGNLSDLQTEISRQTTVFDLLSSAASRLKSALDSVMGGSMTMEEANRAVESATDDLAASFDTAGKKGDDLKAAQARLAAGFDITTDAGRANRTQVEQSVQSILAYASAAVGAGATNEQAAASVDFLTGNLKTQLEQAGFTEQQVDDYLTTLGLTPDNVDTAIKLAGDAAAKAQLETLLGDMDGIDAGAKAQIEALINQGQYQQALTLAETLAGMSGKKVTVDVWANFHAAGESARTNTLPSGYSQADIDAWIKANTPGSADGRYVPAGSNLLSTFGEQGPEAILPLDNPARLRELLGDPRIGGPVASVLGTAKGAASAAADTSTSGASGGFGSNPASASSVGFMADLHANEMLSTDAMNDFLTAAGLTWQDAVNSLATKAPDDTSANQASQDDLMANKHSEGALSDDDYAAYLDKRQGEEAQFSDAQESLWSKLQSVRADMAKQQQDQADAAQKARDDALADQDQKMSAEHDLGLISNAQYEDYLGTRQQDYALYSQGWMAIHDQIAAIDKEDADDAKKQADDAQKLRDDDLAAQDAKMAAEHEMGVLSDADYEAYLLSRQQSYALYSDGWMAIWRTIQAMHKQQNDDAAADAQSLLDLTTKASAAAQKASQAQKDLLDATDANNAASAAYDTSSVANYWTSQNANATADQRTSASQQQASDAQALADAAYKFRDAQANAAGFDDYTHDWNQYMRSNLQADIDWSASHNKPDVAAAIERYLVGVPSFAYGGYADPSPGGSIVRVAEAGQREWVLPDDKYMALQSMAAGGSRMANWSPSSPASSAPSVSQVPLELTVKFPDGTIERAATKVVVDWERRTVAMASAGARP